MAGITIRTTPDLLKAKAVGFEGRIGSIENELKCIEETITGLRGNWEGNAAAVFDRQYKKLREEFRKVIRDLQSHPVRLLTMAGIYSGMEKEAVTEAVRLPADVIR